MSCQLPLTPETLICSMLDPNAFGVHYATATEKKVREAAIFLDLYPDLREESLRVPREWNAQAIHLHLVEVSQPLGPQPAGFAYESASTSAVGG